jgi:hypothetical protein
MPRRPTPGPAARPPKVHALEAREPSSSRLRSIGGGHHAVEDGTTTCPRRLLPLVSELAAVNVRPAEPSAAGVPRDRLSLFFSWIDRLLD